MSEYFWNTVLAISSLFWFVALSFLAYSFGMMIVALDWKKFVLALAIFAAVSLSELVLAALAHP